MFLDGIFIKDSSVWKKTNLFKQFKAYKIFHRDVFKSSEITVCKSHTEISVQDHFLQKYFTFSRNFSCSRFWPRQLLLLRLLEVLSPLDSYAGFSAPCPDWAFKRRVTAPLAVGTGCREVNCCCWGFTGCYKDSKVSQKYIKSHLTDQFRK